MLTTFTLLNVVLELRTDDAAFAEEFASVFGGRQPEDFGNLPRAILGATLTPPSSNAWGELTITSDTPIDGAAFLLGFSSATIPLRSAEPSDPEWVSLALGDDPEPVFAFRDGVCRFRAVPRWRRILAHYLFLRMLVLRQEALFFHAASVGIGGRGVLLIGPKGTGKSTLSLGLAARGHAFLGDETAAYVPSTRTLLPFRRPAGVKPGPRSEAVAQSIDRVRPVADEDGMLRVDAATLFELAPVSPLPLNGVVFLQGFGDEAHIESVQAGRDELSQMQPMATTLSAAPPAARVFEMIRLLGSVRCYRMTSGNPDKTIEILEGVFSS
ncbi:MAG: HPr Serine kinase C-terminal domain [Acidobacteriota bacterium]|nr:HPr Serine kinase C-terminal domain [Acidobacteriota bacterium]